MYAIVDIECTGGNAFTDKITEIAVYLHNGITITDSFISLVNPERQIPEFVSKLTGITDQMVSSAPRFNEIANHILTLTEGKIFVGHGVLVDYLFVKHEFRTIGIDYTRDTLCTCVLSKKVLPGHGSYSLGKLCNQLNIKIEGRHRAGGDALATAKLFDIILQNGGLALIKDHIKVPDEEVQIPDCIRPDVLALLPTQPGIFYLYNQTGELLFVNKTVSLRKGVVDFVTRTKGNKGQRIRQELHEIKHEACGNEIIAAIREEEEIKLLKPLYNKVHPRQVKIKILPGIQSALLIAKGRNENEQGVLLIEQGKLTGYGFTSQDNIINWKHFIQPTNNGTHFHSMVLRMIKHRRFENIITL